MPTTQPHLEISDGTTSIKLMDSSATTATAIAAMPYRLAYGGWAPKIARRNLNPLGFPYLPVREELTINIHGTTPADCFAKLQALSTLIDQGERWYNNEIVAPVLVKYLPLGSNRSTNLQDVVIGGATDDSNALIETVDDFNATGFTSKLAGIRVSFWRRNGIWLGETEQLSNTNVAQDTAMVVNWSDFAPNLAPIDIEIGGNSASDNTSGGFTLVAHDQDFIKVFLATAATVSGASSVADATNFPTGAQIRRFNTTASGAIEWAISSMPFTEAEYFAVFAKVKNVSTTVDARMRAYRIFPLQYAPYVRVPAVATPVASVYFLGLFPTRGRQPIASGGLEFGIELTSLSGNLNFDFDSIAILLINRASNAIGAPANATTTQVTHYTLASGNQYNIRNRLLIEPQPLVAINTPPNDYGVQYNGSAYCFTGASASVKQTAVLEYYTDGAAWTILNSARSAKITMDLRATRYKSYLTPE